MAARSWNKVELIGNLTRDPELRYTPTGTAVATFSVATNRSFVSEGERKEEVDFHRIVAWSKLAELCSQLLKKGNKVFVSGRLQNRSWEAQDGQTKQVTEIVIEDMILLTSLSGGGGGGDRGEFVADVPEELPSRSADEMPGEEVKSEKSKVKNDGDDTDESKKKAAPKMEKEEVEDLDDLPF